MLRENFQSVSQNKRCAVEKSTAHRINRTNRNHSILVNLFHFYSKSHGRCRRNCLLGRSIQQNAVFLRLLLKLWRPSPCALSAEQPSSRHAHKDHGENPHINQNGGQAAERFRHIFVAVTCQRLRKHECSQKERYACPNRESCRLMWAHSKTALHIRHRQHDAVDRSRRKDRPNLAVNFR